MKNNIDAIQRKFDNQLPPGYDDEESPDQERLDELDSKQDRYNDECNIIIESQGVLLEKIGESRSEDERNVLKLQFLNAQSLWSTLDPLTVDELLDREEITQKLGRIK